MSVYDIVYVCVCVCLFVCLHVLINHVELEVIEINSSFANSHSFFPVVCLSVCLCVHGLFIPVVTFNQVDPTIGTVGFGSGLHGWAFTLKQFAEIYSDKFKIDPPKLMRRLWGDQFYSPKDKKWNKTGGLGYVRGFCQFVLDPIFKVSYLHLRIVEFHQLCLS